MKPEIPKVALLIETSRGYGRVMLLGIVSYDRLHGPWRFYVPPGDFEQALPQMKQWGGAGISARIETARLAEAGFEPMIYDCPRSRHGGHWERAQAILASWLAQLPKPIGLMSCNDDRGPLVLDACRASKVSVSFKVAVIGVDNDELLCELADPPMSSVALAAEAGGYRAAALLDKMMSGEVKKRERLIVEPT